MKVFLGCAAQGILGAHRHLRATPKRSSYSSYCVLSGVGILFPGVKRVAKAVIHLSWSSGNAASVKLVAVVSINLLYDTRSFWPLSVLSCSVVWRGDIHGYRASGQIPAGADKPRLIIIAHDRTRIAGHQVISHSAAWPAGTPGPASGCFDEPSRHHAVLCSHPL